MKAINVAKLASVVGGVILSGDPNTVVELVGTDSRETQPGMLFIPISGEKFDGHDYIGAALAAGAAGCLCARAPEELREDKYYVRVPDTLLAYRDLAAWYRSRFDVPVVQVTGSVGKTTAKDMIASVLSQKYHTLRTAKNFNNEIGTPMTLLRLDDSYEAAVIETGMDRAGQIRYLGGMVKPDVAVITNVGDMHIEYLGSRENILKAKCEIFENLAPDGVAVLNGDDELLNTVTLPQRIIRAGLGDGCGVRVADVRDHGLKGVACAVETERARYALSIPTPGRHMVYPAALAVAVGEALGLTPAQIERGVAAYEPSGSRMRIVWLDGGRCLIDDCYNAGPQSVRAALEVLKYGGEATVAVLGNMEELGDKTVSAHREIGALAKELGIGLVIAVGEKAKDIAEAAGGRWFATTDEAMDAIRAAFTPGTTLLLKASHSMRFEKLAGELTK